MNPVDLRDGDTSIEAPSSADLRDGDMDLGGESVPVQRATRSEGEASKVIGMGASAPVFCSDASKPWTKT
jgi:hypothetical protein